ncbi:winged helix-turn-helix domain-containing protein [Streptomyces sp. NPDC096095]|uniref:winged helix-turn-helix domain-containing protein n=1 Tax=Streptomyces sp. NPDC096095 TaxID=3155545 RepID=UPI00332A74CB
MANTRAFPAAPAAQPTGLSPAAHPSRHRLRAGDRDEAAGPAGVAGFLPPGATWLPAPPHTLPDLPGMPPMVGYLVLVPAGRQPALAGDAAAEQRPVGPPFDPRAAVGEEEAEEASGGPVRIDAGRRTASVDGVALDLTYLEFELLAHLVAHPHQVHTRDRLVSTVWGYGHVGDGRTVDVHIARLRRKLGAEYRGSIRTVRRVGYTYVPRPSG